MVQQKALSQLAELQRQKHRATHAATAASSHKGNDTGSYNRDQDDAMQQPAVAVNVLSPGTGAAKTQPTGLVVFGIQKQMGQQDPRVSRAQHTHHHAKAHSSYEVVTSSMGKQQTPNSSVQDHAGLPAAAAIQQTAGVPTGTVLPAGAKHAQAQIYPSVRTATQTSGFKVVSSTQPGPVGSSTVPSSQKAMPGQARQQSTQERPLQQQASNGVLNGIGAARNNHHTYGILHTTHTFTCSAGPLPHTGQSAGVQVLRTQQGRDGIGAGVPVTEAHVRNASQTQQQPATSAVAVGCALSQTTGQGGNMGSPGGSAPAAGDASLLALPQPVQPAGGQQGEATESHVRSELDAVEQRKQARRWHRKRLAEIVVGHWQAVAQPRLQVVRANRHHRQQLLGGALVALQSNVVAAAAGWRLAAVHAAKCTCLRLHHTMQAWHAFAEYSLSLKNIKRQLQTRHLQRRQQAAFCTWRDWHHARVRHRKQQVQALFYYSFVTLSKVLREWQARVSIHKHLATLLQQACSHHERNLKSRVIHSWKEAKQYIQYKRVLQQRASKWHRLHSNGTVLHAWRELTGVLKQARSEACVRLQAVQVSWQQATAAGALREWHAVCVQRKALSKLLTHATLHLQSKRLSLCLSSWASWARTQRELRLASGALAPLAHIWRLHVWWQLLCTAVQVSQDIRSGALRERVLLAATFRMLNYYREHHHRKRQVQAAWDSAVLRMRRRAVLHAWRREAMRQFHKAMAWQHAQDTHRVRVLNRCMHGWQQDVAYHQAKALMWQAGVQHYQAHLQQRAWRAWHAYHSWQVVKREVVAWANRGLLATVLTAWHTYTQQQLHEEKQWRAAVRHRYLTLISTTWSAFQLALQAAAEKRARYRHAAEHYQQQLMKRSLHAWARLFLPQAAGARARAAQAALHWRLKLLRLVFDGWVTESARLAIKHGRERQADAFATQCRMARTLLCWAEGVHLQRLRRGVKARQLAAAQQALACKQVARLFSAWREVQAHLIVKHIQSARATFHWQEHTVQRAMRAWRAALQRSHVKSQQLAKAKLHWAQQCLRAAWPAWLQYTFLRQHKYAQVVRATRHWVRSLWSRGLHALRWYSIYRTQKVTDMQRALQLHRHSLLREGVTKWLEVGTWRAKFRLQHLANTQARELAVQLALVEPYARHWRRVTRARNASRAAATLPTAMSGMGMLTMPYMPALPPMIVSPPHLWCAVPKAGGLPAHASMTTPYPLKAGHEAATPFPSRLPASHAAVTSYPSSLQAGHVTSLGLVAPTATAAAWPPLPAYMSPRRAANTSQADAVLPGSHVSAQPALSHTQLGLQAQTLSPQAQNLSQQAQNSELIRAGSELRLRSQSQNSSSQRHSDGVLEPQRTQQLSPQQLTSAVGASEQGTLQGAVQSQQEMLSDADQVQHRYCYDQQRQQQQQPTQQQMQHSAAMMNPRASAVHRQQQGGAFVHLTTPTWEQQQQQQQNSTAIMAADKEQRQQQQQQVLQLQPRHVQQVHTTAAGSTSSQADDRPTRHDTGQLGVDKRALETSPAQVPTVTPSRRQRPAPRLPAFLAQELAPLAGTGSPVASTPCP